MKAILQWGSGLAAVLLFVSTSHAYDWVSPVFKWPIQTAPDACGPGWYNVAGCGMLYGPNHYVVPPWMPFNGLLPGPGGQCLMAARAGIPPWMMQQAGPGYGAHMPGMPSPPGMPMLGPAAPNTPMPPYAANTPMPPYPPGTPMPPGTPRPPGAPTPPVPDNRVYPGVYPTHPYIRSPRDFFMWNEAMEDLRGQDMRPNIVIPR